MNLDWFYESCGEGRTRSEIDCHARNTDREEWAIFAGVMFAVGLFCFAVVALWS